MLTGRIAVSVILNVLCYRDLKIENLLLDANHNIKIIGKSNGGVVETFQAKFKELMRKTVIILYYCNLHLITSLQRVEEVLCLLFDSLSCFALKINSFCVLTPFMPTFFQES